MTHAMLAWAAAWLVVAVLGCVRLLRASSQPEVPVKNAYRWFAVAAVCVASGATVQQAFGGLAGGAQPLRLADLISLAALPALVIGLATLTAGRAGETRPQRGMLIDSCLLTGALFVVLLVTLFGPDYVPAEIGRAAFALALIRPVAGLIALGVVLRFAVRNAARTVFPVLAIAVLVAADSLAVADRVAGQVPGLGSQIAVTAALALLALAPTRMPGPATAVLASTGDRTGSRGFTAMVSSPVTRLVRSDGAWSSPATVAALAATACAAIVVTGFAIAGRPLLARPLAAAGSVIVLLLVARFAGLTRQATAVAEAAQESDWMFRALAGTTSDAVLICGRDGTIEYASLAVGEFGYEAADLTGRLLTDIVHPEDRPAAVRAALARLRAAAGTSAFAGRVRGADGSWRHVESTLSRYGEADEPARLLITARDVSDRVALRRQLTQLIYHDGLTGLPNRAYVEDRVRDANGTGLIGAILVDFDGYAAVNEVAGHAAGDLVLAQAGRRLRAAVPPAATVARWGGDEFAILLGPDDASGQAAAQDVIELAERLAGLIAAEPFSVVGKEIALTASVGAAMATAGEPGQVVSHAETALAKAQEAGVGRVEIFAAAMHAEAERRRELTDSLGLAIAGHELEIEYLPVIDLITSQVRGVEAAPRWTRHLEPVAPAEFLPAAEDSGLIVELGGWLLHRACRQVAAWRAAGSQLGLSVACTARQVSEPGFASLVLSALDGAGLPPEALTLEVTERVLTGSAPSVATDLAGLRGKGVRLALDCFGTGLVSLASLRNAAVDVVKIDASYVAALDADPTLAALTRSIIQLGRDLGIEVVANGIERPEQRWRLESMGCVLGQGPGLAASVPASEPDPPPAAQPADTACTAAG